MVGFDFTGKTVWVTGAGKGIGYTTALAFVDAGARVTGFDLAFDGEAYPFATEVMNVADARQVAQVCERLLANTERLDVLVNAAGILRMGPTDALSAEDWQQTFAVNGRRVQSVSAHHGAVSPPAGRGDSHRCIGCGTYATHRYERLRRVKSRAEKRH